MSPKLAAMISCRPSAPRPNGNRASVADRAGLMRKMPSAERASNSIMFLFCSSQVLSRSSPRNHFEIHEMYFAAAWFCGEREADRQRRISPRRGISKRSGLQFLNGMTRRVTVGCDAAGCFILSVVFDAASWCYRDCSGCVCSARSDRERQAEVELGLACCSDAGCLKQKRAARNEPLF